jgi:hypothetical protein
VAQKILQGKNVANIAQVFHREGMAEAVSVDLVIPDLLPDPL